MPQFHGKVTGYLEVGRGQRAEQSAFTPHNGPIMYVPRNALPDDRIPDRPFVVGSARFYPLGQAIEQDAVIAALADHPFWQFAVLRYWLQGIGKRLLATAYIWGLAEWPMYRQQTWRDVYVFRWVARLLGKA